jgi:hypothetical protein
MVAQSTFPKSMASLSVAQSNIQCDISGSDVFDTSKLSSPCREALEDCLSVSLAAHLCRRTGSRTRHHVVHRPDTRPCMYHIAFFLSTGLCTSDILALRLNTGEMVAIKQGALFSFATSSISVSAACASELWDVLIVGMSSSSYFCQIPG